VYKPLFRGIPCTWLMLTPTIRNLTTLVDWTSAVPDGRENGGGAAEGGTVFSIA